MQSIKNINLISVHVLLMWTLLMLIMLYRQYLVMHNNSASLVSEKIWPMSKPFLMKVQVTFHVDRSCM
jgi:hypothetical protein